MGNSNASRRIFEQLDKDCKGKITLHELVANSENTESAVPTLCSLTTLYHFDYGKEGSLNFKEFVELEKFVEKIQKKCKKRKKHHHRHHDEEHSVKNFMVMLLRKLNHDGEELAHHQHSLSQPLGFLSHQSSPIQKANPGIVINGSGMVKSVSTNSFASNEKRSKLKSLTVALDGVEKANSTNTSNASTPVCMHTSYRTTSSVPSDDSESTDDEPRQSLDRETDAETIHDIKEQITVELLPSLNKEVYSKQGRKDFLNWLFKLTDENKDNEISRDELEWILAAVEKDDIDLRSLLFDDCNPDVIRNHDSIVTCVMEEYDTRKKGALSKSDFLKLSDLILSKYEARHMQSVEGGVLKDWKLSHILGEGGYGVVRYATRIHPQPNLPPHAAVKIIKRGNVSDMSKLDVEIQAMQMLKFPHVVQLYEVLEDDEYIYLVMELCGGGSLYEHLKDVPFDEELARYYFNQLIDGLAYCHDHGVCHRDLRLENLLLDNAGNLKITDFGQARIFKKGWDIFSTQLVGSLYHLSPEQINNKAYSGEKVDIWNAGIILYCFLTSRLPFCNSDVMQMFDDIKRVSYEYPTDDPRIKVSDDAKDLITSLLNVEPKERPTLEQIKKHRWTTGKQRKPQLAIQKIRFAKFFKKNDNQSTVKDFIETALSKLSIHHRACDKDVEKDVMGVIDVKSIEEDAPEVPVKPFLVIKCIDAKRNIKFAVMAEREGDQLELTFKLRSGETKEFRTVMEKVTNIMKKM
jgi:serine/threonine protein kinase/Ca2+-binding EF-hand superfamily protein